MRKIFNLLYISIFAVMLFSCVDDEPFPAPPVVTGVALSPVAPEASDNVTISATVADIAGVKAVKLFYKIDAGSFTSVDMVKSGSTMIYSATIPAQPAGTTVSYYIEAENVIDKKTFFPASAPNTPSTYMIGGAILMHYWHFNGITGRIDAPNTVASDYTFAGLGAASLLYEGAYLDAINPGTDILAQMGAEAGVGLRIRSAYGDVIITAPSTGFKDLEMSFALSRSGTGANTAEVLYSADGGATWVSIQTVSGFEGEPTWTGYSLDMKSISALNNKANLMFKIIPSNSTSGNLRMDNLSVSGLRL